MESASDERRKAGQILPELTGMLYVEYLHHLHATLQPKTYLEIGAYSGLSLAEAQCKTIAIDPQFKISSNVILSKPSLHLYQMSSDDFFKKYDPCAVLGDKIDIAFMDGMHWFEFALRDFTNLEPFCRANSIIILHDCVPTDPYTATRENDGAWRESMGAHVGWWLGDTWKMMLALKKYRPDLSITPLNCKPSGLVLISALDPKSTVLSNSYNKILSEFVGISLIEYGIKRFLDDLGVIDTSRMMHRQDLSARFWL